VAGKEEAVLLIKLVQGQIGSLQTLMGVIVLASLLPIILQKELVEEEHSEQLKEQVVYQEESSLEK